MNKYLHLLDKVASEANMKDLKVLKLLAKVEKTLYEKI